MFFCTILSAKTFYLLTFDDLIKFYSNYIDFDVIEVEIKLWYRYLAIVIVKRIGDIFNHCNVHLFLAIIYLYNYVYFYLLQKHFIKPNEVFPY